MSDDLIINNPAKFQLFASLLSSAVIGVTTTHPKETDPETIARRADKIAMEAMKRFEKRLPDAGPVNDAPASPRPGVGIIVPGGEERDDGAPEMPIKLGMTADLHGGQPVPTPDPEGDADAGDESGDTPTTTEE